MLKVTSEKRKKKEAGKQASSFPPPCSHCRNTAQQPSALNKGLPLATLVGSSSSTSGKGSNFLQSLHSAGSNQGNAKEQSYQSPAAFWAEGKGEHEVSGALGPQGKRSSASPGQQGLEYSPKMHVRAPGIAV